MSKEKHERKCRHHRRAFSNKVLILVSASVLLIGGIVSSTIAWLTAQTEEVKNVFTASDIDVELTETKAEYKMIPGWKISKDPKAKVTSGSEDCYLFIKVEKNGGNITVDGQTYAFDNFLAYAIDEKWTALSKYPGIYYMEIDEDDEKDKDYIILGTGTYTDTDSIKYDWEDNEVLVKPEVTKKMMEAVTDTNKPTLSFTAYAVQLWKSNESDDAGAKFTPEEAWLKISPASGS